MGFLKKFLYQRPCKYKTTIQITTTTTTTPSQQITVLTSSDPTETTIDPPPQKGCGSCSQSVEDDTCFTDSDPLLGLGCRACGIDKCRHCGFGPYPACTAVSNVEIGSSCNDCDRSVEDKKCGDPTTDPFGGLGCNACGKRTCRHCGFGPYPACDALSKPMKDECGRCPRSKKDSRCANAGTDPHGGLGCNACGVSQICRFCGFDHWPACPGDESKPASECDSCSRSKKDSRCANPGTDPHGGMGCNACGVSQICRFCGFDHWPACPSEPKPVKNECCAKAVKDERCKSVVTDAFGGLGCKACGTDECRYCGFSHFPACP